MKTRTLLLLLAVFYGLTIPLHAQQDAFHPFLQDGKNWEFDRYSYNEDWEPVKTGKRIECISGDTVINDKVWKKCFTNYSDGESLSYYAALRQEGERIYVVTDNDTKERLLYDFGIKPGDILYRAERNGDSFEFLVAPDEWPESGVDFFCRKKIDYMKLQSIDTIHVDGTPLRRFVFKSDWMLKAPPRRVNSFDYPNLVWVEGIGSQGGLLHSWSSEETVYVPKEDYVFCCQLDGKPVFEYADFFVPESNPLSESILTAAFTLFSKLAENPEASGNLCFSPLSAQLVLSMVANGADGSTLREMQQALGTYGYSNEEVNAYYKSLAASLTYRWPFYPNDWKLDKSEDDETALNRYYAYYPVCEIANSVWHHPEVSLFESFTDVLKDSYDAGFGSAEFDTQEGIDLINSWANDKTHGMIPAIFDEPLTADIAVVLADALYFKGSWTTPFEKVDTKPGVFQLADGNTVTTDMMSAKSEYRLSENGRFRAITLPYGTGDFSMTLFVPVEGTTLPELTLDDWTMTMNPRIKTTPVCLTMPKFSIDGRYDLEPVLNALGMVEAFGGGADFSKMSDLPLQIDKALQLGRISVDEDGTEASAVSVVTMEKSAVPSSDYEDFPVDRPFYFTIENRKEQSVLFVGRVTTLPDTSVSRFDGDVNDDGETNISDIVTIINVMAGKDAGTGTEMNAPAAKAKSDVNHDGKTDISDITAVINIMAGQK